MKRLCLNLRLTLRGGHPRQVGEQLGDTVKILKIDTDENPELSSQLQARHRTPAAGVAPIPACCILHRMAIFHHVNAGLMVLLALFCTGPKRHRTHFAVSLDPSACRLEELWCHGMTTCGSNGSWSEGPLTFGSSLPVQIQGLPTLVFVGTDVTKPAFRTEGLLPAGEILKVLDMIKQG